jgi:hypothetical protein
MHKLKNEILALTAGVLKAEVLSQKSYITDDAFGIEVAVRVIVDTSVLETSLKRVMQDRILYEQLIQARANERELLKKIAMLEEENQKGGKSKEISANLKNEFQAASQGLTAVDWFQKALEFWADGKFTDPGKTIEYMSEAIRLKPDYTAAHTNRGLAYIHSGNNREGCRSFITACELGNCKGYDIARKEGYCR